MNEKKIVKFLMMKIIDKAQTGQDELNRPLREGDRIDETILSVCFKDVEFYARMILEDG